jgi:uncharacterized protein YgbK (DUF1537 family)
MKPAGGSAGTQPTPVNRAELLASLPPVWPDASLAAQIAAQVNAGHRKVIALDDDPTGSQTMHDIDVLTTWDVDRLGAALRGADPCFYVLTNSRSLPTEAARALNAEIATNLAQAGRLTGVDFEVISRSDSTLRGHYPAEIDALAETLAREAGWRIAGHVIVPYFLAGGRYTIDNIHWVAEDDMLVPAAETEYAHDPAFGYRASELREWVAEKTAGRYAAAGVAAVTLDDLRLGGPAQVAAILSQVSADDAGTPAGRPVILNAAADRDLEVFVSGLLDVEAAAPGRRFLFRSGASLVRVRSGLTERPLLTGQELGLPDVAFGGLVIVGSYIQKSGAQLAAMLELPGVTGIELHVERVLDPAARSAEIATAAAQADAVIAGDRVAVVYTSRAHVAGDGHDAALRISRSVSAALVEVTRGLKATPRFIVAKGGITSHDIAVKGLDVERARVLGQIAPGVSVWRLGAESRYPGLPYVVFPGNVGGPGTLAEVVKGIRASRRAAAS